MLEANTHWINSFLSSACQLITGPPSGGKPSGGLSALRAGGGRGLILMHMFMDEVTFNSAGNEVVLVKRKAGK